MATEPLPRLDSDTEIQTELLAYCRLKPGDVWEDPVHGHRIGVLDVTCPDAVLKMMGDKKAQVAVNDPPYNVSVGNKTTQNLNKLNLVEYMEFSRHWVENTIEILDENSHFYAWLGADQKDNFQPLPDFMVMMREFEDLEARKFHHDAKSAGVWHSEKLDGGKTGIALLYQGQSRFRRCLYGYT